MGHVGWLAAIVGQVRPSLNAPGLTVVARDDVPLLRQGVEGRLSLRKLTTEQVQAAHRLHIEGGLSIRELGRKLYERYGYASAKGCAMALSTAFRRHGLSRRDRIEATIAASTTHGHGSRANKAAYKRWHRSTFGPWPSDHGGASRG